LYSIPTAEETHLADEVSRSEHNMAQRTGQAKWFNNAKGYGFIGRGPDVFCHFTSIQGDGYRGLKEGDDVEFDIVEGEKGRPQTHEVRKLTAKS
jgi:CspA family cold shock protein